MHSVYCQLSTLSHNSPDQIFMYVGDSLVHEMRIIGAILFFKWSPEYNDTELQWNLFKTKPGDDFTNIYDVL